MLTGPNVQKVGDILDLKNERFVGVIAGGTLSTGQPYEIRFSRKSAVSEGVHLVISFPGAAELSEAEKIDCFAAINRFASSLPLAQQFGYRYDQNFGLMQTRPEPHAHVIIPGSVEERSKAPRVVDSWDK